jgi:hypothetical protein
MTPHLRRLRQAAIALSTVLAALIVAPTAAHAGYDGFLADSDDHYVTECGRFWPTTDTFHTSTGGDRFAATWDFTLTQGQLDALKCIESKYSAKYLELDFRLFDFAGPNGWDGYQIDGTDLPSAVHDVAWMDSAANATPGLTGIVVDNLHAGHSYYAGISWSGGLQPVSGGKPRVSFQWVPSYWASSLAEKAVCNSHGGSAGWCVFGKVTAFVSHGLRNTFSVQFSGEQTYQYPVDLGVYGGHLVQWDDDPKAQRTAWLVTPDLKRLWVPDGGTWNCLKGRGAPGPDLLRPAVLDRLPDQTNMWAACGDTLAVNRVLRRNMYLRSSDGRYTLWLQGDGNLVLYGPSGRALWANSRFTTDFVIMQGDGNLVGYRDVGGPTWASNTDRSGGNRLVVQNDGNLVIYSSTRAVWASNTAGRS